MPGSPGHIRRDSVVIEDPDDHRFSSPSWNVSSFSSSRSQLYFSTAQRLPPLEPHSTSGGPG